MMFINGNGQFAGMKMYLYLHFVRSFIVCSEDQQRICKAVAEKGPTAKKASRVDNTLSTARNCPKQSRWIL